MCHRWHIVKELDFNLTLTLNNHLTEAGQATNKPIPAFR